MFNRSTNTAFLIALSVAAVMGQSPMECVKDLTVPSFEPTVMGFAPATGTIFLTIGPGGSVASVRFDSRNQRLNRELENTFRFAAQYSAACVGKTVSFSVTYMLSNEPPQVNPSATVKFQAPNRFIVESPPMKPIRDRHQSGDGPFH